MPKVERPATRRQTGTGQWAWQSPAIPTGSLLDQAADRSLVFV
jgi:hypothetical protein